MFNKKAYPSKKFFAEFIVIEVVFSTTEQIFVADWMRANLFFKS